MKQSALIIIDAVNVSISCSLMKTDKEEIQFHCRKIAEFISRILLRGDVNLEKNFQEMPINILLRATNLIRN